MGMAFRNQKLADRVMALRKTGLSGERIAERLGISKSHAYYYVNGGNKKASKVVQSSPVAPNGVPAGLNGLGKVWLKAERLIDRARRIKAAVKELNKALHS